MIISDQLFATTSQTVFRIYPVSNRSTQDASCKRIQFPLKLAWSITIHKSQGLTLKSCIIGLGPSEKVAGLAYVALSRVRSITDLVIKPMSFERLHLLKKTSNDKFRLLEEARLDKLTQRTVESHIGCFDAHYKL